MESQILMTSTEVAAYAAHRLLTTPTNRKQTGGISIKRFSDVDDDE